MEGETDTHREREWERHTHTQKKKKLHECMKWPILWLLWWAWSSDSSSPGGEVPAAADEASSELMLDRRVSAFSFCNPFKASSEDARLSRSLSLFTLQSRHKLILLSYKYSSLLLLQFCRWCVRVWLRCFPAVATKIYNNNKTSLAFQELMRLSPSFVCFFFCCCFVFFFDPSVYGNSSLQAQLMIMTSKPDCDFSSSSWIIIFSSEEKDSQITYVVQILSFSFRDRHTNRLLDDGFFVLFLQQCFGL